MSKHKRFQLRDGTPGLVKIRLWHGKGFSLVIPDLLVVPQGAVSLWYQPVNIMPSIISQLEGRCICSVHMDLKQNEAVRLQFEPTDRRAVDPDGSEWYDCKVHFLNKITADPSGLCKIDERGRVLLRLFHHTTFPAKRSIEESESFRLSSWNIQGTKELSNISFHNLTQLKSISTDEDLRRIGMSPDEFILLGTDNLPSTSLNRRELDECEDEVLRLKVYRSTTRDRNARVEAWVDPAHLTPKHMYVHRIPGNAVYYEICHPYIHRIGARPGELLPLKNGVILTNQSQLQGLDYLVLGDATCKEGLEAPYDEENTRYMMKLQRIPGDQTIPEYWMQNANQDLFTGLDVWLQEFKK